MTDYFPDEDAQKSKSWTRLAILATVLVASVLIGGGWWLNGQIEAGKPVPIDSVGCPSDSRETSEHLIVLVDVTDPLSPATMEKARSLVEDHVKSLPIYARFTVVELREDEHRPVRQLSSACKLPIKHWTWRWTGQEEPTSFKRARPSFDRGTQTMNEALRSSGGQAASPILEAITALTKRPDYRSGGGRRKLIVVSDLLQKSSWMDIYQARLSPETVRQTDSWDAFPDLSGTKVIVLQTLERAANADGQIAAEAREFWEATLADARADAEIIPVPAVKVDP